MQLTKDFVGPGHPPKKVAFQVPEFAPALGLPRRLAAARAVVRRGASRGVGSSDSPPSRVPALTARHHASPPNRCAMPACGLIVQLVELTTEFRAVTEHLVRLNGAIRQA